MKEIFCFFSYREDNVLLSSISSNNGTAIKFLRELGQINNQYKIQLCIHAQWDQANKNRLVGVMEVMQTFIDCDCILSDRIVYVKINVLLYFVHLCMGCSGSGGFKSKQYKHHHNSTQDAML